MKKSERLIDMMIYLNNKNYFNLKDIMEKYNISKSTALRDIQSLEEIGMPIFSEMGRHGKYGILKNRLLPPITFTTDEMYALYFAMLTLKSYQSTPFHLNATNLKKKFETWLPKKFYDNIKKMEMILSFQAPKHHNFSPFLNDILQMAIEEKLCHITYQKNGLLRDYYVQFFDISSAYGQWYVSTYNYKIDKISAFRCDKIQSVAPSDKYQPQPMNDLISYASNANIYKSETAVDFEVHISPKAVDLFHKENYPSMKLTLENGQYIIKGFYNESEEQFIARYFISYGELIEAIAPACLKNLIINNLHAMAEYYKQTLD